MLVDKSKTLDTGFRRDDISRTVGLKPSSPTCDDCCAGRSHATRIPTVIPAKGEAGVSDCWRSAGGLLAVCLRNGTGLQASARPARGDPVSFVVQLLIFLFSSS